MQEGVKDVVEAALLVERLYYELPVGVATTEEFKHAMFRLRKALEGIYGHELPRSTDAVDSASVD